MNADHALYADLLGDIKSHIRQAQNRAAHAANAELVRLYWDIGRLIDQRQGQEGWSAGVIPRLARDLKNELPELKGFSERNLGRMVAFFRAYPAPREFLPQPVEKIGSKGKLPQPVEKKKGPLPVAQSNASGIEEAISPDALWEIRRFLGAESSQLRQFFSVFSVRSALGGELIWTHCRFLMRAGNRGVRARYPSSSIWGAVRPKLTWAGPMGGKTRRPRVVFERIHRSELKYPRRGGANQPSVQRTSAAEQRSRPLSR